MKTFALSIWALVLFGGAVFVALESQAVKSSTPSIPAQAKINSQPQASIEPVPDNPLTLPLANPRIVIFKGKRRLLLYSGKKLLRTYRIGLGFNPVDDKTKEGDGATPEGEFYIFTKNESSAYYLSLGLSYPNIEDAKRGLRAGLIYKEQYQQIIDAIRVKEMPPQETALGGQIYIHGNGSRKDWTWSCVALDNRDMKQLFEAVQKGTKVVIKH